MDKNVFLKIVEILQRTENNIDKLHEIGISFVDSSFNNDIIVLTNYIISSEYNNEGVDWFLWWLYELPTIKERKDSNEPYANYANGEPIIIDTAEQLYEFLEKDYKNVKN